MIKALEMLRPVGYNMLSKEPVTRVRLATRFPSCDF